MMPPSAPVHRPLALWFICTTIGLDMLSFGMTAPVLPGLVKEFSGGSSGTAAEMLGYFSAVWALLQLFASPILGALSDRFGRRPVIILSNLGMGLDYVVMALAPNLIWLFLGRIVSGATAASIPTAMAYVTDITPPQSRATAFGRISAAIGLGFVAGPAFGGLLGSINPRLPFWVAALLGLANAAFGASVLKESLPKGLRHPFRWRNVHVVSGLRLLAGTESMRRRSLSLALGFLAQQVMVSVFVLYVMQRLGWNEATTGLALAMYGLGSAIVGGLAVQPAIAALGARRALMLALLLTALGYGACASGAPGELFALGTLLMTFWGMAAAVIQASMTSASGADSQGRLQGSINSMRSIAAMVGPIALGWVYQWSVNPRSPVGMNGGTCFLLCAAMIAASMLLLVRTPKDEY